MEISPLGPPSSPGPVYTLRTVVGPESVNVPDSNHD
jgi:hypothetical protein